MLTFYIRGRSSLRIHSLAAGNTLIAAHLAPVAPHGEIQTSGKHGLLCDDLGRHARQGVHFGISTGLVNVRLAARI